MGGAKLGWVVSFFSLQADASMQNEAEDAKAALF